MKKTILMLGTFDSKGKEFDYLYRELERRGADIIAMDVGIFEPVGSFPVRIAAQEVALAGGVPLEELRKKGDRGWAMKIMCLGARKIAVGLEAEHSIQGVIGMGGRRRNIHCSHSHAGPSIGVPQGVYYYTGVRGYKGVCGYQGHCAVPVHCGYLRAEPFFQDDHIKGSRSGLGDDAV